MEVSTSPPFLLPFPVLEGEKVLHTEETERSKSVYVLTNYRFYSSSPTSSSSNVLLGLIDQVEQRELRQLTLLCKQGPVHVVSFASVDVCDWWQTRIVEALNVANETPFAFVHKSCKKDGDEQDMMVEDESSEHGQDDDDDGVHLDSTTESTWFPMELTRLGFDLRTAWRRTTSNLNHVLCSSYPEELLVPMSITDHDLEKVALFRSARRFPSVVWRDTSTGAVLARCSQPEVGWLWCRCPEDEKLVRAIADACAFDKGIKNRHCSTSSTATSSSAASAPPITSTLTMKDSTMTSNDDGSLMDGQTVKAVSMTTEDLSAEATKMLKNSSSKGLLILDLRSYVATLGNRCARGGGAECQEYYPETEIVFMGLANIHSVRKSFHALRSLLHNKEPHGYLANLESTKWLALLSSLMHTGVVCARALHQDGRAVLVHCSDGWDRTSQVVSLAELLLDPFYRSMKGFEVLVEKEWLAYGHKMADRCGTANASPDASERCPVFLQWIDCVYQLLVQFPCHFEFNAAYLVRVAVHAYAQLFGTFLFNCQKERREHKVRNRTKSLWPFLKSRPRLFKNLLYKNNHDVLSPKVDVKDLVVFTELYAPRNTEKDQLSGIEVDENIENCIIEKAVDVSSCIDDEDCNDKDEDKNDLMEGINGVGTAGQEEHVNSDSSSHNLETNKEVSQDACVDSPQQLASKLKLSSTPTKASRSSIAGSSVPHWMLHQEQLGTLTEFGPNIDVPNGPDMPNNTGTDSDGLRTSTSVVQERLVEIMEEHERQVQILRRDLFMTRMALIRASNEGNQGANPVRGRSEQCEIKNINAEDMTSGIQSGSVASEASSWEAVDETEAKPTLWVPDHAADHCMRCGQKFWLGLRRHHCRVCGRLFCADCSSKYSPLPDEQLHYPVRVCEECHNMMYPDNIVPSTTVPATQTTTMMTSANTVIVGEDEDDDGLEVGVEACAAALDVILKAKA